MKIYLTGQNNFGNRGCEALVRSTVQAVRSVLPDATFLVPSGDIPRDAAQWPELSANGVELVPVSPVPWRINKWGGLCGRWPPAAGLYWPKLPLESLDAKYIDRADLVLSIGGDNYSLDYGVASLAYFVGVAELAMSLGKPVALWGASVGPFDRMPAVEQRIAHHLRRLKFVSVRESRSVEYLAGIGVRDNLLKVVDTAFLLTPQAFDTAAFWPQTAGSGVVGVNVSWLVDEVRRQRGLKADVVAETAAFIKRVMGETDLSVLLVPHVAPLDGSTFNSDDLMNTRIAEAIGPEVSGRLAVVPSGLNAAQTKYVISQCRFLIAARTHATIAAFSACVPAISIAYSVKAQGINDDLFGHQRYVLETPAVSAASLWSALSVLRSEEAAIRELYRQRLPGWRETAMAGAVRLADSRQ